MEEADGIDSASEHLGAAAVSAIQGRGWEGRGPGGAGGRRPLYGPHSMKENASPLKSRGPPTSPEPEQEPEPEPRCREAERDGREGVTSEPERRAGSARVQTREFERESGVCAAARCAPRAPAPIGLGSGGARGPRGDARLGPGWRPGGAETPAMWGNAARIRSGLASGRRWPERGGAGRGAEGQWPRRCGPGGGRSGWPGPAEGVTPLVLAGERPEGGKACWVWVERVTLA